VARGVAVDRLDRPAIGLVQLGVERRAPSKAAEEESADQCPGPKVKNKAKAGAELVFRAEALDDRRSAASPTQPVVAGIAIYAEAAGKLVGDTRNGADRADPALRIVNGRPVARRLRGDAEIGVA
jgi:hypothetical protein